MAPSNDNFSSAAAISTSLPVTLTSVTTLDATKESSEVNFGSSPSVDQSIWYTFTPTSSGFYRFKIYNKRRNGDSPFNFGEIYMLMRQGVSAITDFIQFYPPDTANGVFPQIGGSAFSATLPDSSRPINAIRYLTSGVTYHLKIWSPTRNDNNFNGYTVLFDFDVSAVSLSPPANDDFADAIALSTSLPNFRTADTLLDATGEIGEYTNGQGVNGSVWYTFTPSTSSRYKFRIPNASLNFVGTGPTTWGHAYIEIHDVAAVTDVSNSSIIGTQDYTDLDTSTADAEAVAELTSGHTYYIKVYQYISDRDLNYAAVEFDLEWEEFPLPPDATNNDFADRVTLTGTSGSEPGSNFGADLETDEDELYAIGSGGIEYGGGRSVWYEWTAPDSADYRFETVADGVEPIGDSILTVVTGTGPGSFTIIGQNDDDTSGYSAVTFTAVMGTTYYLSVDGYQGYDPSDSNWDPTNANQGTFALAWDYAAPPPPTPAANDNFANKITLPYSFKVCATGRTDGATVEFSEPNTNPGSHSPPYPSVWYTFRPPNYERTPLNFTFDTLGSAAETYLEVFTGSSLGGLSLVGSDHNSGAGGKSQVTVSLTGDVNYRVRVSSPDTAWGDFNLNITAQVGGSPPSNDAFASAEALTGYSDSASGTTAGANAQCGEPQWGGDFGGVTNTVWYKWTPPQTGRVELKLTSAAVDLSAFVARGTALNNLVQVENIGPSVSGGGTDTIYFSAESGVQYYFIVQGDGGEEGTFTIALEMSSASAPANDAPANATVITVDNVSGTITQTTEGANWDTVGPNVGDFVTEADENISIWYKLTTGDRLGSLVLTYVSSTSFNETDYHTDGFYEVYRGADIATAVLAASGGNPDNSFVGHTSEISLLPNETYWILVQSFGWLTALNLGYVITLQIEGTGGFTPDPVNGEADFDSTTGFFEGDPIDGDFVASGGVGYGTISPWTDSDNIHYPYGWWCRFELRSTSGDYLYRYGQSQQFIEVFRATKTGGDYHSVVVIGHVTGTQTLGIGVNGTVVYDSGYHVWGANTQGCSDKVRIEVGRNGLTIDGRNHFLKSFDNPYFYDTKADQFTSFDFGIRSYPSTGSAYVDLDPEWNFRYSDIRIHDNPNECVLGPADLSVREITSIQGWTFGALLYNQHSIYQQRSFLVQSTTNLPTVVASAGDYDGYSLDCSVSSPSITTAKGYQWLRAVSDGASETPFTEPACDSYFPGFSFRFDVRDFPSTDLVIASISNRQPFTDGSFNGTFLVVGTDGTLYIKPSYDSDLIPFCFIQENSWNYIELQADTSTRKYATKIWLQNVYIGRFETTTVPVSTTRVPTEPPMWNHFKIGRMGNLSPYTDNSATLVQIEFRDVATTRRKIDRPLGPTIVIHKTLNGTGVHNYPDPDTFEPNVDDEAFNNDFSGGADGYGQPHYWTGIDRHDYVTPPSGAMYLGYLFQQFDDSVVTLGTDGSGPPGHTGESALRIQASGTGGAGAAYVFGGAVSPAVDLTFPYVYADTICAQFWIKGVAGQTVRAYANTGIGDWDSLNTHTMTGAWEHVKLWLRPQNVTGTVYLSDIVIQFDNSVTSDVYLIKDFHLYVNPENNPPNFYQTDNDGASVTRVPLGDTASWQKIDEFPPTEGADHIYMNTESLLTKARGAENDGKTHLPPQWSDSYLEYRFNTYGDEEAIYGIKILLGVKNYTGPNLNETVNFADFSQGSGLTHFVEADEDGNYRFAGYHIGKWHIDDDVTTLHGVQLSRPPGLGEWTITKWNAFRSRFGFHEHMFQNSVAIISDYTQAGVVQGVAAELLTFDRRLSPPLCAKLMSFDKIVSLRH